MNKNIKNLALGAWYGLVILILFITGEQVRIERLNYEQEKTIERIEKAFAENQNSALFFDSNFNLNGSFDLDVYQQSDNTDVSKGSEDPLQKTTESLARFFKRFDSPWQGLEEDFIRIAQKYELPWWLLPLIGCVESSCGRHYYLNAFGWGSDTLNAGGTLADAEMVAEGIKKLPAYKRFRKTGSLADFARGYNRPYWKTYLAKLNWFYENLD